MTISTRYSSDENIIISDEVFVYKNLHKNCFSLRNTTTRRVAGNHKDTVFLKNATFKVSASGREKVVATKRKLVHAGIQGTEISEMEFEGQLSESKKELIQVGYNPYLNQSFVCCLGRVDFALFVKLEHDEFGKSRIFAYGIG